MKTFIWLGGKSKSFRLGGIIGRDLYPCNSSSPLWFEFPELMTERGEKCASLSSFLFLFPSSVVEECLGLGLGATGST